MRALEKRDLHLVGDRVELVADDLQGDWVQRLVRGLDHLFAPEVAVTITLPVPWTSAWFPGYSTRVESNCSTIAGPVSWLPTSSSARRCTGTVTQPAGAAKWAWRTP